MAFARKYEYYEVRDMLKTAEGANSPVTNQGGHSRGLHAMTAGGLDLAAQLHRVTKAPGESNSQFKNRGGTGKTGAFKTLLQQGSAACEGLNSTAGQAALAVFDDAAHAGKKIRIVLSVSGIKESGFLPGTLSPHATTVKKNDVAVQTLATSGVQLILDRGANGTSFQIQTCYPLTDPFVTNWDAKEMPANVVLASG